MKIAKSLAIIVSMLAALGAQGQNTIQFNSVTNTEEGAIRLSWASNSNEVYQIQCTDTLIDTNSGLTPWQVLCDNYPSHGTNTFWLDTGNYGADTPIVHPKYSPMRFYRILSEGTNSGEAPIVTVTSPTNGSVLSGQATISVTKISSYPNVSIELFVDGQRMKPTLDGTNFVINTCEWPNGPHTLFATAKALSGFPGPIGSLGILEGQAVSTYVPVTFSNLITKVAFSQVYFEPSLGQTQEVTAAFGANVDWTLQIIDDSSNAVRTVTGSGTSLVYDWDGTGEGGTNIPDGVYHYQISAVTNGGDFSMVLSGAISSSMVSSTYQPEIPWVLQPNGATVPLALFPPQITNGMTIVQASSSEIWPDEEASLLSGGVSGSGGAASPDFAGPDDQTTTAPTRPDTAPIKNILYTYGIAYWDYLGGRTLDIPQDGKPFPSTGHIHINDGTDASVGFDNLGNDGAAAAIRLRSVFEDRGWKQRFERHDNQLTTLDLRRNDLSYFGGEILTTVTLGIFLSHGCYGSAPDFSPGSSGSEQTYFPSGNLADTGVDSFDRGWLRMCQIGFGGNLKWAIMNGCNSLNDPNYTSMSSVGAIPLKTTHLLCGVSTTDDQNGDFFLQWGLKVFAANETIAQAWFDAARQNLSTVTPTNGPIVYRVTGYAECFSDTIVSNTPPSSPSSAPRNLIEQHQTVYP